MTEAKQIESLQNENAALRQRIAALELKLATRDAVAVAPPEQSAALLNLRLTRLVEQAPAIIFEVSTDLQTRMWNQTAARVFGYAENEMLGKNPFKIFFQPVELAEFERRIADMRTAGWTRSVYPATTKDGRQVLCSWLATYTTDEAGQIIGIGCYGRDITEERATERARREGEALFAATFETAGVGLCCTDERGCFIRVNSAYCKMYGWTSAELLGQHFSIIFPPELRDWASKGYQRLVQSNFVGVMPSAEVNITRRDGTPIIIASTYSMLTLEGGRRVQVWAVSDVTERKEQAAAMQQRMQDAQREAVEKTRLLAELDQKLEVIDRQHQQILALSAPVLDVWDGVLLLPLIGRLDGRRVSTITELLLQAVVERRTRNVILDMTSLEMLDTANVGYIGTMVQALRLLGVRSIITGIRATTAQTMVRMGVDLHGVATVRDLQQGLRACIDPQSRS